MVEESPVLLPPVEESIEAEIDTALEPEIESAEPAPEPTSEPGFVCDCEEDLRSACNRLPFYKEHEGRRYCVLHYPDKEKSADFRIALEKKLKEKDFNFLGVWFPDEVDFWGYEFSADTYFSDATFRAPADFSHATFRAAVFFSGAMFRGAAAFARTDFGATAHFDRANFSADADFICSTFRAANFSYATFSAYVEFISATFSDETDFSSCTFTSAADFRSAVFGSSANFIAATFGAAAGFEGSRFDARVDFSSASFYGNVRFFRNLGIITDDASLTGLELGENPSLGFQHAIVEHPDRVAFHTLNLRPHWFVNVDPRRFVFTDVGWQWDRISIKQEIAALEAKDVSFPIRLLAIACRQLAENSEANNRYEEASRFRYWAMDLARRTKWKRWTFWKTDWLHMLYWAVSGYGERILRALGVLAVVWLVFVLLYTRVGFGQKQPSTQAASSVVEAPIAVEDKTGQPLEFSRALTYSLGVMSLQKPEPRPLTNWAHTLVTVETILGPVQAALLLLAIRRKFMR